MSTDEIQELCESTIAFYGGEYEFRCVLPAGHEGDHRSGQDPAVMAIVWTDPM